MQKNKVGVAIFVFASAAWGSTGACNTSAATSGEITNYQGTANYCTDVDKTFDNFGVSATTGSTAGFAPSLTDIEMYGSGSLSASGTGYSTAGFAGSIGENLAATGAIWDLTGNTETSSGTIANTVTASGHPAGNSSLDYDITDVQLDPAGSVAWTGTLASGDEEIEIVETICLDADCVAANEATITATINPVGATGSPVTTFTFSCSAVGSNISSTNCATDGEVTFAGVSSVSVSQAISVIRTTGFTATVDLTDDLTEFGESAEPAPEPSTFVLLGSALGGLGFLRARGKRA